MRTKTTAAEDLKPGDRVVEPDGISVITKIAGPNLPDTGVGVYARREVVPAGISPTWSLGASYWDEFEVIVP